MTPNDSPNPYKLTGFIFISGCVAALIIPWFLKVEPSISESYYYGFSNKAATAILLLTTAVCFFLLYKYSNESLKKYFDIDKYFSDSDDAESKYRLKYKLLYLIAGISLIIFFYLINWSGISFFSEGALFTKRLYLMQDGLKPYTDFEFPYGAQMLYVPFFLIRYFNFNVVPAYEISVFAEAVIGYFSLWFLCKKVSGPGFNNKIFFLLFLPSYALLYQQGINYTLFRYCTPLLIIVWSYKHIFTSPLKAVICSFFIFISIILISSPEIAIASMLALFSCFILSRSFSLKSFLTLLPILLTLGLSCVYLDFIKKSFVTLFTFSKGGNNFPWLISPLFIAFLLYIFISLIIVLNYRLRKDNYGAHLIILLFSVFSLPGALGRCDGGHMFFYGMWFFLLILSAVPYVVLGKLRTFISASYKYTFFLLITLGTLYGIRGMRLMYTDFFHNKYPATVKNKISNSDPQIEQLILHARSKPLVLIVLYYDFYENPALRKKLDFPYFLDGLNNYSMYSEQVLIDEIAKHNTVLVPRNKAMVCSFVPVDRKTLTFLYGMYPYIYGHSKNDPSIISEKVCVSLEQNFVNDTTVHSDNYLVYRSKSKENEPISSKQND